MPESSWHIDKFFKEMPKDNLQTQITFPYFKVYYSKNSEFASLAGSDEQIYTWNRKAEFQLLIAQKYSTTDTEMLQGTYMPLLTHTNTLMCSLSKAM